MGWQQRSSQHVLFPARTRQSAGQDARKTVPGLHAYRCGDVLLVSLVQSHQFRHRRKRMYLYPRTTRVSRSKAASPPLTTNIATAQLQRGDCARAPRTAAHTSVREPALELFPMSTTLASRCAESAPACSYLLGSLSGGSRVCRSYCGK